MPFLTSKSFGGASGFSCCYRDHHDEESTLGQLHGAVLSFKIMFESDTLNPRDKVVNPETMEALEEFLEDNFGHTTIIAQDDPSMEAFEQLDEDGAIDLVVLPSTSLECFAKATFEFIQHWMDKEGLSERVFLHSVECREHEGNAAIYARDDTVIELKQDEDDGSTQAAN